MTRLIVALNRVFRRPNVGGRESQQAYSEWEHHWGKEFARIFMEPAGDLGGKHLLDVGCGLGGKTVAYAEAGAVVVGTDLLEKNVEQSGAYAKMRGARADFFVGDAAALPLADAAAECHQQQALAGWVEDQGRVGLGQQVLGLGLPWPLQGDAAGMAGGQAAIGAVGQGSRHLHQGLVARHQQIRQRPGAQARASRPIHPPRPSK